MLKLEDGHILKTRSIACPKTGRDYDTGTHPAGEICPGCGKDLIRLARVEMVDPLMGLYLGDKSLWETHSS